MAHTRETRPYRRRIVFTWLLLALPALVQAETLPKGVDRVTATEGITEYRLSNGLKVLLLPDESKPTILVNITYLVGSRHENYGESGMAHLLEHLMFKGTSKNPAIPDELKKRGMRTNASTGIDRTNYFEIFQASDDNLKWALELEADRMINSFIAQKDLNSEMTVVRNEFESGENNPTAVLTKRLQSVMFDWHNNGNSTIGNRSDIERVKIENLQAFYRTYYQPDNAVLLVAGKFDANQALGMVAKIFGAVPKPKRSLPAFWTVEPTQDGERSFVVRRKGDLQLVIVAYHIPGALHRDTTALAYAGGILANTPNGRLHKQLVVSGKAVQVARIGFAGYAPGFMAIGAVVKKGDPLEPVRDALITAAEEFAKTPPTADEMERVRSINRNAVEKMLTNHEVIGLGLSEAISLGDWRMLFQRRDLDASVTSEQVAAAAQRYFKRDNRTVGLFIPEDDPQRAEIPASPSVEEALSGFTATAASGVIEAFDPSTANINQRTRRLTIAGIDVALLPKKTRGETVSIASNFHWGDEKNLFGKTAIAQLTGNMLLRGTSKYTREQLSDEMLRLKITGNLIGNFETTKSNLSAALKLAAHVRQAPSFSEDEFVQAKKMMLTNLEAGRSNPQTAVGTAMAKHFNHYPRGDIRYKASVDEAITALNAVTLEEVKAFYKQFHGASKGELTIVGDFDPEPTAALIEELYAAWPSKAPYALVTDSHYDAPAVRQFIHTPDKENGFYAAQVNLELRDDDVNYPALLVANQIFGVGLDSRLMARLRQKDGLSYSGSSALRAASIQRVGSFSIGAIAAPQNLSKLETAVREELVRAVKDGFTQAEFERAKSGLLQLRTQSRAYDANLAAIWNENLFLQRTFSWQQELDDRIRSLTLEQVNAAYKAAIDPGKLSVFIAGDETKVDAK